ncbi:MAG: XdhC family protein [Candidatus Bathyarchaeia archaeon]
MQDLYQKIVECLKNGEAVVLASIINTEGSTPRGVGAKMLVRGDGTKYGSVGGDCVEELIRVEALKALQNGESRVRTYKLEEDEKGGVGMLCGGEIGVFVEVLKPKPTLLLIGGGGLAYPLAKLGQMLNFYVTVVDPYLDREKFSFVDEAVCESVESALGKVKITPQTYVVIVTRHKYDEPAVRAVINSPAAYIGLMGSRARVKKVFEALEAEGIPQAKLKKIMAPVGLDIRAETPSEIAVSIIAEIISNMRGGTCTPLSQRRQPLTANVP